MPNSFEWKQNFTDNLDLIFKRESLTGFLGDASGLVRDNMDGHDIKYPQYTVSGLSDYDRENGYAKGTATMVWKTVEPDYDRGKIFQVDTVDNIETAGIAFGALGSEFMRTKVIPEQDAYTFAKIASKVGITSKEEALTTAKAFLDALVAAKTLMDEAEVPSNDRLLFATPTLLNLLINMNDYESKQALSAFSQTISVPQSRFYTSITLNNDTEGGFIKTVAGQDVQAGKNINFLIAYRPAIIKYNKHTASDIIEPAANQSADAYMLKFRSYGVVDVYDNKVKGIYVSHASA